MCDIRNRIKILLIMSKKRYLCTKDLYFSDGSLSFKKGKIYEKINRFGEKLYFIDEQGDEHGTGEPTDPASWFHYFKVPREEKLKRILKK